MSNLGHLYLQTSQYGKAQSYLERALPIQLATQPAYPQTADMLNYLADLHIQLGELEAARPFLEQVGYIQQKILGELHPSQAHTLISWGDFYQEAGEVVQERSYYEQA